MGNLEDICKFVGRTEVMNRFFLIMAGFFGATGVALGALGAHYLKIKLDAKMIDENAYHAFDTATKYQLFHSIALLALFFISKDKKLRWLSMSANLFVIGILLFSGSLYFLATQNLMGLELKFLGPVTPIGGLALIAGWGCLVIHAFSLQKPGENKLRQNQN
jgi:uncharacterized membrane protein YgdD (TMEM256/DUF423 family)